MGRIGRLSSAVVSNLRSNIVVTSFEQAVEELVSNSVDAGATQVLYSGRITLDVLLFRHILQGFGCF